eukprot:12686053-Heterocapsa_arctica.AAC.1
MSSMIEAHAGSCNGPGKSTPTRRVSGRPARIVTASVTPCAHPAYAQALAAGRHAHASQGGLGI